MNNPNKQAEIKWFLHLNKIGLFGLVETKVKIHQFDSVLNNLGQHWQGVNNNMHHPGGRVWVIWAPHMFKVQVIDCSSQQITSEITEIVTGDRFYFTVVYGFNEESSRTQLWSEMQHIKDHNSLPWCICGDFNVVLNYSERLGSPVSGEEIADFRQCVDYCDIMDIQAQGAFFTWNNKQDPSTRVFSRLDRCMITEDWMQLYPDSYAYTL
ncbi:uncharacterized protein LOC141651421 [Silene latifolia]|uniref:uncharacterized protein LOC141651421 n=1 Tax=Silene latifolia TaxID=37657 RepID=UPI003D7834C2